jgi:bifunctional UDP-N-acetylglucosamine pyrophosphorylase/glucosamine-1-phosphate N-acetyltransferase
LAFPALLFSLYLKFNDISIAKMKLNIIILAAGEGKRMRSSLPKALHLIGGMPMLEHVVITAAQLKPYKIYVVHGNGGSRVKEALAHLKVEWIKQKPLLGTGHAVQQVVPHLDDDGRVLILYGDVPLISTKLLQKLLKTPVTEFGLITAILDKPHGLGRIIRDKNNNITAIVEQRDATKEQLKIAEINTGILVAPAQQLKAYVSRLRNDNAQGEYYLTDVIAMAVADGYKINGIAAEKIEEVLGVNDKYQLANLERYYQQQTAQQLMLQGLTLMDPNRFDLRGELKFGTDVVIDANVIMQGKVTLGNNVTIHANCMIADAKIDDNCIIGPFARIRPGSHIKANAHIGNFVELKQTEFGENSKANHLTYLGDATIGNNVNIGAGTITCNYDGVNKYQTIIEDSAFIGSDAKLVAPIKIGKNATIGAGSTLTKNAPADQLTLARPLQRSFPGWKKPKKK